MKQPTPRDVRNAVVLAVLVTMIVMCALFDPSCQRQTDAFRWGPLPSTPPALGRDPALAWPGQMSDETDRAS